MHQLLIILCWLLATSTLFAQASFSPVPSDIHTPTYKGQQLWADIDGDGDPDRIVAGNYRRPYLRNEAVVNIAFNNGKGLLYRLSSTGSFNFMETVAPDTIRTVVALADLDGDGDLDLITNKGVYIGQQGLTFRLHLYENDGQGIFSAPSSSPFPGRIHAVATGDWNGDGHNDLLLAGVDDNGTAFLQAYHNDGTGAFSFTTASTPSLLAVEQPQLLTHDMDGDGDLDLLVQGWRQGLASTQLYLNNNGQWMPSHNFIPSLQASAFVIGDVDGDGDADIIGTGKTTAAAASATTHLWRNDGNGVWADLPQASIPGQLNGQLLLGDWDGDGDLDLVAAGSDASDQESTTLFLNNGSGGFSAAPNVALPQYQYPSLGAADIDQDGSLDLSISGLDANDTPQQRTYFNQGNGNFREQPKFPTTDYYGLKWADIDNDGDLDVMGKGTEASSIPYPIYINHNHHYYEPLSPQDLGLPSRRISFLVDANNDDRPDIISYNVSTRTYEVFLQTGHHQFALSPAHPTLLHVDTLTGYGEFKVEDVDGDGDEDIHVSYAQNNSNIRFLLLINDGQGDYSHVTIPSVPIDAYEVDHFYKDLNNDGLKDWIARYTYLGIDYLLFYAAQAGGGYQVTNLPDITDWHYIHQLAVEDLDGDGDQDLVVGRTSMITGGQAYHIWFNDGSGGFSDADKVYLDSTLLIPAIKIYSVYTSNHVICTDVDRDGDKDIVISGSVDLVPGDHTPKAYLFLNDGTGQFTRDQNVDLMGMNGWIHAGDHDNDGDMDLLFLGATHTVLYENTIVSIATQTLPDPAPASSSIFPNPNHTGLLHLNYTASTAAELQVQVVDLSGKIVDRTTLQVQEGEQTLQFDVQRLPTGVYLVHLYDGATTATHKLVVSH